MTENGDLRRQVIRCLIEQTDPFSGVEHIPQHGWRRRLRRRVEQSRTVQSGLRALETACDRALQGMAGFAGLAFGMIGTGIGIGGLLASAWYLLGAQTPGSVIRSLSSWHSAGGSWSGYLGWAVGGAGLCLLPYLLFGLPVALALRWIRATRMGFAARRLRRTLAWENGNQDPALVAEQAAGWPLPHQRSRLSRASETGLTFVVLPVGSLAAVLAVLTGAVIDLQLVFGALNSPFGGEVGEYMIVAAGILGGLWLLRGLWQAFLSGRAVADLLHRLYRGEGYRRALGAQLAAQARRALWL